VKSAAVSEHKYAAAGASAGERGEKFWKLALERFSAPAVDAEGGPA
jgi:hypothetical protein